MAADLTVTMMNTPPPLFQSELRQFELLARGKVRDIYAIDAEHLLIVASDRISAFDCILPDPIPGKGEVLTAVSNFWFARLGHVIANHVTDLPLDRLIEDPLERLLLRGRAIVTKRLKPLPVEAVVRGYLIGSGWRDYQASSQVCGIALPTGLQQAQQLPEPIFTPSTKAELGQHDQNISFADTERLIGTELAANVRDASLALYREAAAHALARGILIADTKFEFGLDDAGKLYLIDEALTPDSSRFWPADQYQIGTSPPSFDKQYLRDYLESIHWNKAPPAPNLPPEVIARTAAKYREAEQRLTSG